MRLQAMGANGYENGFDISLIPERLNQPKTVRKPTIFFVNSMSDLFHPEVPSSFVDKIINVIYDTPQHKYQILTKRAKNMAEYFKHLEVPDNVWLGVTVENNKHGVPRISQLRKIEAKVKFLSIEPLLEKLYNYSLENIDWVIVGGESGPKARPMDKKWVDDIYSECNKQNIPFFFKQWGTWGPDLVKRSKKTNGRIYNGKTWNMLPIDATE